jgi:phosphoribosylglycinamide formyltransferase 2
MASIGTPFTPEATRVMLCGSGELGKEVVIELQRYGVEVIAVDSYEHAPAMQVADRCHVISMLDGAALRAVIEKEKPHLVVPEVEAIATDTLAEIEAEGRFQHDMGMLAVGRDFSAFGKWDLLGSAATPITKQC